jgi:integrating conjugative element protein (TIGR03746 family)
MSGEAVGARGEVPVNLGKDATLSSANSLGAILKPLFARLVLPSTRVPTLGEGRYRALIDNVQAQNRKLWGLVVVLVVLLAFAVYGLHRARQALPPVHIPPELRFGAMLAWGEVPPPNVYMFAGYIFQQLNLWMKDGHKDYGQNIFRLQAFLTPKYRAELEADLEWRAKRGEIQGRVRQLSLLPGQGFEAKRVEPLGAGRWRIWIDFAIDETVKGMAVKQTLLGGSRLMATGVMSLCGSLRTRRNRPLSSRIAKAPVKAKEQKNHANS